MAALRSVRSLALPRTLVERWELAAPEKPLDQTLASLPRTLHAQVNAALRAGNGRDVRCPVVGVLSPARLNMTIHERLEFSGRRELSAGPHDAVAVRCVEIDLRVEPEGRDGGTDSLTVRL